MAQRKTTKKAAKKGGPPAVEALPEAAAQRLLRIQELCADVLRSESADAARELAAESADLEALFRGLRERAETFARASEEREQNLAAIRASVSELPIETPADVELSGARPGAGGEPLLLEEFSIFGDNDKKKPEGEDGGLSLDKFMRQVAESIVSAQRRLDLESLAYARQLEGSPIAPAHFAIPNVKAEVKLGLSSKEGGNVLVHLFGSPQEKAAFSESTVSFEIVAAPPPPGGTGQYSAPIPEFLVVAEERESVLDRVSAVAGNVDRTRAAVLRNAAKDGAVAAEKDYRPYIVLLPGAAKDDASRAVRISLDAAEPAFTETAPPKTFFAHLIMDAASRLRAWEASVTLPAA